MLFFPEFRSIFPFNQRTRLFVHVLLDVETVVAARAVDPSLVVLIIMKLGKCIKYIYLFVSPLGSHPLRTSRFIVHHDVVRATNHIRASSDQVLAR